MITSIVFQDGTNTLVSLSRLTNKETTAATTVRPWGGHPLHQREVIASSTADGPFNMGSLIYPHTYCL
jgi:hypothetical protein